MYKLKRLRNLSFRSVYLLVVHLTTLFSNYDYTASDEWVIDEWWIGNDLEGRGRGLIKNSRCIRVEKLKMLMLVFWYMTSCRLVGGYQRFEGTCCFHLTLYIRTYINTYFPTSPLLPWRWRLFLETLVSACESTRRYSPEEQLRQNLPNREVAQAIHTFILPELSRYKFVESRHEVEWSCCVFLKTTYLHWLKRPAKYRWSNWLRSEGMTTLLGQDYPHLMGWR
jgi:hypothetical protein